MIYPMVPFPVTLRDPLAGLQGHGVIFRPIDALNVLCAQLTRDQFAIAKFLYDLEINLVKIDAYLESMRMTISPTK